MVRPVPPPVAGVYSQDRVRVTAYALSLSEMLGEDVKGGYLEYIPGGESRYCAVQPGDMRKFYSGLHAARNIEAGSIPKKPLRASCDSCSFSQRCDAGPARLSDRL